MRLTLNGWPPLASHLACLILGVGAANLSVEAPAESVRLPARSVAVTVPRAKGPMRAKSGLAPGARAFAVRGGGTEGSAECRLSDEPLLVVEALPAWTLAAPLSEAATLPRIARDLPAGKVALRPADAARALPRCASAPRVTYGSP